jgi:hypothetical protein
MPSEDERKWILSYTRLFQWKSILDGEASLFFSCDSILEGKRGSSEGICKDPEDGKIRCFLSYPEMVYNTSGWDKEVLRRCVRFEACVQEKESLMTGKEAVSFLSSSSSDRDLSPLPPGSCKSSNIAYALGMPIPRKKPVILKIRDLASETGNVFPALRMRREIDFFPDLVNSEYGGDLKSALKSASPSFFISDLSDLLMQLSPLPLDAFVTGVEEYTFQMTRYSKASGGTFRRVLSSMHHFLQAVRHSPSTPEHDSFLAMRNTCNLFSKEIYSIFYPGSSIPLPSMVAC